LVVGFEVLTALGMKIKVFQDVIPCSSERAGLSFPLSSAGFLLELLFASEYCGGMLFRNVGLSTNVTARKTVLFTLTVFEESAEDSIWT
jgi:hypothetical protein